MQAEITYTRDTGEKLVNETFGPNNIRRRSSGMEERHRVDIADGREARDLALDGNGFVLVEHRTAMHDFFDAAELKRVYYPEVQNLIGQVAGAQRVVVFDHTLRSGDEAEREAKLVREPVLSAHNDYTEWSGPHRVRDLMCAEGERLLQRRSFALLSNALQTCGFSPLRPGLLPASLDRWAIASISALTRARGAAFCRPRSAAAPRGTPSASAATSPIRRTAQPRSSS